MTRRSITRCPLLLLGMTLAAAVAAFPVARAAEPAPKPDLVFLLAGQSNMVGHGQAAELPAEYAKAPANILLYQAGKLRPLSPRQTNRGAKGGGFGPEISFGHELSKALPDRTIVLVKQAVGGTSLSGHWNPKVRERLYDQLLSDYRAATKGRKTELAGVLWSQGGADAKAEASARAYAANLKALIASLRKDLDAQDLPIFVGSARPEDPTPQGMKARFPHLDLVRAAFAEAEKTVPHTHIVSTVGLQLGADGIHYDTAGQLEFGKRFARAYLEHRPAAEKSR